SHATELAESAEARGVLGVQDVDYFRFQVTNEAQLYRVQAVGQGVTQLSVYSGGGTLIARERGAGRIRLDDLLLLPGAQYFAVEGEGEYAVRAIPLGPAPSADNAEGMPGENQPLSSAPAAPVEPSAEDAATGPLVVETPEPVTPPPGYLEYEPNNDNSRAHRLRPGAVHVGRLSTPNDEDHYRFYLAADQLVRLELVPPEGTASLSFDLNGEGRFRTVAGEEGAAVVMERWLLAGDHSLYVHGRGLDEVPAGYYQLRLTLRSVLDLPVDLEPNDSVATASRMPAELRWEGVVGEIGDADFYVFPAFDEEAQATLLLETEGRVTPRLRLDSGVTNLRAAEDGSYPVTLTPGQANYLELQGSGRYLLDVSFSRPPDAEHLLPPRGEGALDLSVLVPAHELAAFSHEGQRVLADASVTNNSGEAQDVTIAVAVNDARVAVEVPESVRLQPGESVQVPVVLEMPADMRDDPLYMEVVVSSGAGRAAFQSDFYLACSGEPVEPFPYHSLPASLLGRPDVLWSGFGAAVHGDSGFLNRDRTLIDGRTTVSYGGYADPNHSPTFVLAGDAPVTLVATSLHPQAGVSRNDQLRRFRIETSLDGARFAPVFEGELQAAHIEQVFEFDAPVLARYVRLVAVDNIAGQPRGYVGEWKLYAQEADLFSGLNLADPMLGGHVVWTSPRFGSDILSSDPRTSQVDVRASGGLTFVIGFQHARAALVSELWWQESERGLTALDERAGNVLVEASLGGAAGPWEPIAEWELERDASGAARLEFGEPVWARYLRFTAPKGAADSMLPPQQLSVFEADVGTNGYLSVLGEWGNMTQAAAYELLVDAGGGTQVVRSWGNHKREDAWTLEPGVPVDGTVSIGEKEAWFKVTVGQVQNHVQLRLSGDPTIAYLYELTDATGRRVTYEVQQDGDDDVVTFFAEPGDYYLGLSEPKRTVVFSWDTSGSVGPYIPITYSSLAEFARVVDGEREAVQLLAYNNPTPDWLLPIWSSDPLRVQQSIQEYDRSGDSSNTEIALLTAVRALADREGTKAVLLITDAESDGDNLTPDLWRAMEEVRPRVFTFEISSGGSDYAQDMMQDYAAVNGGYYDMADGVGDFDAGFARASCMLRRPKGYEVEVAVGTVAPPGPGLLNVVLAQGAARPSVEVIFDASGSMGQVLPSGEQRITAAKRALETLVGEVLPDGTPFALRAFGHISPTSCDTRLDVPLGDIDRAKALSAVRAIEPKLLSGTPIAASLAAVAEDLSKAGGARQVILITDGEESCGGDPAAEVRRLREAGPLSLAIVSLALEPEALAVFEALAEEVGASYVDVGSYEALNTAIAEALNPAYEVYDLDGNLVAQGRVGGEAVELPMGLYRVRVLSAPVEVFDNVRVPGDGSVTVNAGR
ncbi:MAG: VWA domain-containing protein, partial [Trueperaceae bacterium]